MLHMYDILEELDYLCNLTFGLQAPSHASSDKDTNKKTQLKKWGNRFTLVNAF